MTIVVTGAAGGLGGAAVDSLLERGVPAAEIVATTRDPGRLAALAARGVQVRYADYADPESLRAAFAGADRLLLVSSNGRGDRVAEHRTAIGAAREVGISSLVYTSLLHADTAHMTAVAPHLATERLLHEFDVPATILRNGPYFENHLVQLPFVKAARTLYGSAGDSPISGALRSEYAAAAAAVLTGSGHDGRTYELGGDTPFTLPDLAGELSRRWGEAIHYVDLSDLGALSAALTAIGVPAFFAPVVLDTGLGAARGELFTDSRDLHTLLGRPPASLATVLDRTISNRPGVTADAERSNGAGSPAGGRAPA